MASGLKFETLVTKKQLKRYAQPSFILELREYIFYFLRVFISIVALFIFIRFMVFDLIGVSGRSMYPNYNEFTTDDAIYIDQFSKFFSDYQRGDVIVIIAPERCDRNKSLYIKRVVGLPGEQIAFEGGEVFVINDNYPSGIKLDETGYLNPSVRTFKQALQDDGLRTVERKLGPDEYYFLGDNRPGSADSRVCGPINRSEILGREFFRLSPNEKRGWFTNPSFNISTQN